ncbi:PREDICTED: coiled-coil domain-containing protein 8 [Chrysochloris asiatica]|uniref:Coiled-coil domain-containing protein 8 n=1 Tax=Chrysochloris asiatica TaxID=185453 RepID=A0A9B0TQ91_CHRAS|nr:PREDICTED: coiled-coil domain-containing protein 8 [Chrysochloris asiatica]
MLQIGEDVDYLLIPREVRLAGGVWRVISKPATKEAEFRERLTQFLEEEGRTLEDVARIIEKSTPHPPQPSKKPQAPRVQRRIQQMVIPPPRLVVGTYDSSNASDSEFSDFETNRDRKGDHSSRRTRRVRKMPVSYLGSKFLGSDQESGDDEELVEAFLRRGEKKPNAAPARRRVAVPVPVVEDNPPQRSKADRWREYASQVSWGRLKRRVKSWAPRSFPGVGEAQSAVSRVESDRTSGPSRPCESRENAGDGRGTGTPPRRWRPKINWASLRRRRKEDAAFIAQGAEVPAGEPEEVAVPAGQGAGVEADQEAEVLVGQRAEVDADQVAQADQRAGVLADQRARVPADQRAGVLADQGAEIPVDQGAGVPADQGAEIPVDQGAGVPADQRAGVPADQRAGVPADQGAGVLADQGAEIPADQGAEIPADQRAGVPADQGAEILADQRAEAPAIQEASGALPGARAQKHVKTVRFQTPGRFSWFRLRRRAFWHTPRLPTLPKRVPRAGEARSLRVLRAEARADAEQADQEDQL